MAGKGTQTPAYWYDGSPVPWTMRLLAPLYAGVTALRRRAYRRGWRKRHSLPVPVIVVGNITAGGTGKTPLTIALVERLRAAGTPLGVVSSSKNAEEVLAAAGIRDFFRIVMDGVVAAREGLRSKPAPDMFS